MGLEQDRMMLARAELADQVDALRLTAFESSPVQYLMRLDHIRRDAQQFRFDAVAEIASAFEAALQKGIEKGEVHCVADNYMAVLAEAVGAQQLDAAAANALLANVAMRLNG